ncbi:MAG: CinA family protein [Litorimonas sp.]
MSKTSPSGIHELSSEIIASAKARGLTIATAESCTGGLIGAALTSVNGSSESFHGGIIAYSNSIKTKLLGVPPSTLGKYGAVSEKTAQRMAAGALERLNVDIAISVTGIAGPSGGSEDKPVGTVWIGVAMRNGDKAAISAQLHNFRQNDRNEIRSAACYEALALLKKTLS